MTAAAGSKSIKDGNGVLFLMGLWDSSGAGTGPFYPSPVLVDVNGVPFTKTNPLPIAERAIFDSADIALDSIVAAGRQFCAICTVKGNVRLQLSSGAFKVIPLYVGMTLLPWEVVQVTTTGTTATATYSNLS